MKYYLITFLLAFGISFMLTPLVRRISLTMKWMDNPNWRKVNRKPMPLVGGLAIFAGFAIALVTVLPKTSLATNMHTLFKLLACAFIIMLVGIADDIIGLSPRRKLFYQVAVSVIVYFLGFSILKISNPLGGYFDTPFWLGLGVTVFWIVGFTNSINLMDGLDGLAAGISAIIAGSLFLTGIRWNNPTVAILSIALAGGALGFLRHNFYPAKIFMGDTGSMFLGFMLAIISMESSYKGMTFATLIIPIVAMGVPVVDTGLAILRRLIKGNGVFKADKDHIHHKMFFREGSQKKAVIALYLVTGSFGLIATALSKMQGIYALAALVITVVLTIRWIINSKLIDLEVKE
jgi:UDP-GlcNAc:undecaprenyl-phosphate GlcNAc-1-phosphate transferase